MGKYVIAYDIGTTGVKTCLFEIDETIKLVDGESMGYGLYLVEGGGAEQDAEEWWGAMAETTKKILDKTGVNPKKLKEFLSAPRCRA